MSSLGGHGSPVNGGGYSEGQSPPVAKFIVPRLSLPESSAPQASPRVPLSPRGAGPNSPNAKQKVAPGSDQKGSPRFGETPRDSARWSARRRTEDSVNAYIMRRQSCNSTGKRSSAGSGSRVSTRRPNPLLSGNAKNETPARRRSPRDVTPEHCPDTGGASCSGARGSGSAHSTPVRGGVHAKHRRTSSPSPVLLKDVMRAVASSLSSLGAGDAHPQALHGDHEACSLSSIGAGDATTIHHEDHEVTVDPPFNMAHLVQDIPVIHAAAVGSRGTSTGTSAERRISAESRYSGDQHLDIAVESAFAANPGATRRISAESRYSSEPMMTTQRISQNERTAHSTEMPFSDSSAPAWAPARAEQHQHRDSSFRFGHKKTPSFTKLGAADADNGALRTARGVSSPVYREDAVRHLEREHGADLNQLDDDDDELHGGNSTYARLEELTDKVQRLFLEVSASVAEPVPAQAPMRPAVGPPCRPPRPPPAVMPISAIPGYGCVIQSSPAATPDGMTSFPAQNELGEEELSRLKFRVHHLEMSLQRRAEPGPIDSAACGQEIVALKTQLEDTRAELVEARDEIQQARVQIHVLSQRMNGMQLAPGDSGQPQLTVTPRVIPSALASYTPPAPATVTRVNNVPPLPMTARIQQRPPSPHSGAGQALQSVSSSPLPTARMQRQGSIATPNGSYATPNGSYAPPARSNGSYAPPARILINAQCGSARASPLRTQPDIQAHSTACLVGTPPATARMCSSFVAPARGLPLKVMNGGIPAHMVAPPRVAG